MMAWELTEAMWQGAMNTLEDTNKMVTELNEQVLGNGEPEKGMRMRLISLEESRSMLRKIVLAIVGVGGVGGAGTGIWAYLQGLLTKS